MGHVLRMDDNRLHMEKENENDQERTGKQQF